MSGTPEPPLPFPIASCWPQSDQSCLVPASWQVALPEAHNSRASISLRVPKCEIKEPFPLPNLVIWTICYSKGKLTSTKTNVTSELLINRHILKQWHTGLSAGLLRTFAIKNKVTPQGGGGILSASSVFGCTFLLFRLICILVLVLSWKIFKDILGMCFT